MPLWSDGNPEFDIPPGQCLSTILGLDTVEDDVVALEEWIALHTESWTVGHHGVLVPQGQVSVDSQVPAAECFHPERALIESLVVLAVGIEVAIGSDDSISGFQVLTGESPEVPTPLTVIGQHRPSFRSDEGIIAQPEGTESAQLVVAAQVSYATAGHIPAVDEVTGASDCRPPTVTAVGDDS